MKTPKAFTTLLTLLGGLLCGLAASTVLASPQQCLNQCAAERAECRVAAQDLVLSATNRRGSKEMVLADYKGDGTTPATKEMVPVSDVLQARSEDRVKGCERTYNNCANLICPGVN